MSFSREMRNQNPNTLSETKQPVHSRGCPVLNLFNTSLSTRYCRLLLLNERCSAAAGADVPGSGWVRPDGWWCWNVSQPYCPSAAGAASTRLLSQVSGWLLLRLLAARLSQVSLGEPKSFCPFFCFPPQLTLQNWRKIGVFQFPICYCRGKAGV